MGDRRRQRAGRIVHDHQAVMAAPQGAGGVEPPRSRGAAARLVDVTTHGRADRRARDRSGRRVWHRVLVAGDRRVPVRPPRGRRRAIATGRLPCHACSGRQEAAGEWRERGGRGRVPATTWPPRSVWRWARRHRRVDRHVRHGVRRVRPPLRRRHRRGGGIRRRDRSLPAARVHVERGQGARRGPRACSGSITSSSTGWRWRATPGALTLLPYFDGERTPEPARRHRPPRRVAHRRHPRATRPGRCRRCGVRPARRRRRARRALRRGSHRADRRRRPVGRDPHGVRRPVRPAGVRDHRRRSRGRRGMRAGGGDRSPANRTQSIAERWGLGRSEPVEADGSADPVGVRARYAVLRERAVASDRPERRLDGAGPVRAARHRSDVDGSTTCIGLAAGWPSGPTPTTAATRRRCRRSTPPPTPR